MTQIPNDVSVNDFFILLYQSYELEVTESKGNIAKKFAMEQQTPGNQMLLTLKSNIFTVSLFKLNASTALLVDLRNAWMTGWVGLRNGWMGG